MDRTARGIRPAGSVWVVVSCIVLGAGVLGLCSSDAGATPPLSVTGAAAHVAEEHDDGTERQEAPALSDAALGLIAIPTTSQSVGAPSRGRLLNGVELPRNDALYIRRRPENAWGSSFALAHLQRAIGVYQRAIGYGRPLVISDISRKKGGRLQPHNSHQSGRDVDLWLPLKDATAPDVAPSTGLRDVDWHATWCLVRALMETEAVQYVFLHRSRQREVYRAALADGADKTWLRSVLQFPRKAQDKHGVVRHAAGHTRHMHIRFHCGSDEPRCR